jgi:hypothetical protein
MNNLLSKKITKSLAFLDSYWFYPAPLLNLALCRIIFVAFQLEQLLLRDYRTNVLTRADIPSLTYTPLPVLQFLNSLFPWNTPSSFSLSIVFWLSAVCGILALIGLKTNVNLFIFAIGSLYLQSYLYSFGGFHHPEAMMLIALVILALSPCGKLLSVDSLKGKAFSWRANGKSSSVWAMLKQPSLLTATSPFARWPLLLIQWLFSLVYLSAGLNKLVVDGPGLFTLKWMNGYTLQYYLIKDGLMWGSDLGVWIGQQHVLVLLFSVIAIVFETTFFLVLIFPKLIWLYIPAGAAFHMGIYMAQRAPFFQYIALYAAFIPWTAVIKMLIYRFKKAEKQ